MIYKEQDAHDFCCPASFSGGEMGCRGSGCMAWRWFVEQEELFLSNGQPPPAAEERWIFNCSGNNGEAAGGWYTRERQPMRGYCGLGGKPEVID